MDSKVSSTLEKALQDKTKGDYQKALKRLSDAIGKYPEEVDLYLEAAEVCLEGGESLQATQFIKKAQGKFKTEQDKLDSFAREKLKALSDPILGKFLLEQAIKKRALENAAELLEDLPVRAVRELLQRTRTKKQSLTSAAHGGYALKTETLLNTLSEALLCIRLGRMKEAVRSFLQILDEKPVENDVLEPYFAGLEKKYPKAGRIRYAYACSLMVSQQYDKAMSRLVDGIKMEPKIGEDGLTRLRKFSDNFETPPECVRQALVEILLTTGDAPRAAELLEESLADNPEKAKDVLKLIQPYLDSTDNGLLLHYLYMEAALIAEQKQRVLETLKAVNEDASKREDLFDWLETKSKDQFLPAEILVFHGEVAIEMERFDRALEIFGAVANNSHADIPSVLTVLEKNKGRDPRFVEFIEEHAEAHQMPSGSDDGGFEFEHFENNEFKFSNDTPDKSRSEQKKAQPLELEDTSAGARASSEHDFDDQDNVPGDIGEDDPTEKPRSALENGLERAARETSVFEAGSEILWDEEDADGAGTAGEDPGAEEPQDLDEDESWLETNNDSVVPGGAGKVQPVFSDQPQPAPEPDEEPARDQDQPEYQTDETRVRNLAGELREAGAALFFHIDEKAQSNDTVPDAKVEDPEPEPEPATEIPVEEPVKGTEGPGEISGEKTSKDEPDEPAVADGFERNFSRFLDGDLDNQAILGLLEEALKRGCVEELRELLYFRPENSREEYLRKRYQVEYFLYKNLPGRALEVLSGIDLSTLPPEDLKYVLHKKADCQRKTNDFEAAHRTYLRLLGEFPSPDVERVAKTNYEKYLKEQCERDPVLEKTTTLHED